MYCIQIGQNGGKEVTGVQHWWVIAHAGQVLCNWWPMWGERCWLEQGGRPKTTRYTSLMAPFVGSEIAQSGDTIFRYRLFRVAAVRTPVVLVSVTDSNHH